MDIQSMLGYSQGSPYAGNPYLDIDTPEGIITMENTPIDLLGIDNLGNKKKMKAGTKKPYKFAGTTVREIPITQTNENPYMQKGGMSPLDLYNFLYDKSESDDNDNDEKEESSNTAPSEEEIGTDNEQQPPEPDDYEATMGMVMEQDGYQTVMGGPMPGSSESYFTPKITGVNPYSTPTTTANISNPAKYAYEFFKNKGLPAHVAAGIVGNLEQESKFRHDVISDKVKGDNGASHGIAQWQKERWPALKRWASSQGKNHLELDTQLEYVYHEANQRGDLQKTLRAQTPEEAARIFAKYYERPAYIDENRANNARKIYQQK